jgi:hypothetical protein
MKSLVQLLDAQYENAVEYCNAQTALQNAIILLFRTPPSSGRGGGTTRSSSSGSSSTRMNVTSAVQSLQASVSRVQMDLKKLENVLLENDGSNVCYYQNEQEQQEQPMIPLFLLDRVVLQAWTGHVERSRRILATLHASSTTTFAPHGVPTVVVNTAASSSSDDDDDDINTKTIALSTLRASIHQVQEILNHRK